MCQMHHSPLRRLIRAIKSVDKNSFQSDKMGDVIACSDLILDK